MTCSQGYHGVLSTGGTSILGASDFLDLICGENLFYQLETFPDLLLFAGRTLLELGRS
jgi:hypothetical protein